METAQLVVHHVLPLHSLPQGIVSDRGPQVFCSPVEALASLLLGFHPKAHGWTKHNNQTLERMLRCLAFS